MSWFQDNKHKLLGVAALFSFVLLAFILFGGWNFPYASAYAGRSGGELDGWLWRYWWTKKLISTAWNSGASWQYILWLVSVAGSYPETGNLSDLWLFSWPLETIFGAPLYFNVKTWLIFTLNGFSGYLLGCYLFKNKAAGWLSGAVMVFSPYCLTELDSGRIRQAIIFPMVFYCLTLLRLYRKPSLWLVAAVGFWGGLTTIIYLFYGQSLLIFTIIFLLWNGLFGSYGQFTKSKALYLLAACAVTVVVALPSGLAYLAMIFRGNDLPELVLFTNFPSLDVLLSPEPEKILQQNDPLLTSFQRFRFDSLPWQYPFSVKYTRNLPLLVTLMSLLAVPLLWFSQKFAYDLNRDKDQAQTEPFTCAQAGPWLLSLFLFYSLTLGPYLQDINTGDYIAKLHGGWATPYVLFFKYLPAFARLFSPVRMSAMMLIATSVLSGAVIYALQKWHRKYLLSWILTLMAAFIIGANNFYCQAAPITSFNIKTPQCYFRLASQPGAFMVVEVPIRTGDYLQYYQIAHGKRLLLGWADGATPPNYPQSDLQKLTKTIPDLEKNTFLQFIEQLNVDPNSNIEFDYLDYQKLVDEGLLYIIVHERSCWNIDPQNGRYFYDCYCHTLSILFGDPQDRDIEEVFVQNGDAPNQYGIAVFRIDKLKLP